jgi:hypothetical protein
MSNRPIFGWKQQMQWDADKRAQALGGVFAELSKLSPAAAAKELNRRGMKTPGGSNWHAEQVIRVRKRLQTAQ